MTRSRPPRRCLDCGTQALPATRSLVCPACAPRWCKCVICGTRRKRAAARASCCQECERALSATNGHSEWVPPPEVDTTRAERLLLMAERAAAGKGLFEETSHAG